MSNVQWWEVVEITLWCTLAWIHSFVVPQTENCDLTWNGWHDLTANLINKSSEGKFFFPPLWCTHVCNLCFSMTSQCWMRPPPPPPTPRVQSKSMQNKQEMATIEVDGRRRRSRVFRQWGRWRVRRCIPAGEFLAVKTQVSFSFLQKEKNSRVLFYSVSTTTLCLSSTQNLIVRV